MIVVGVVVFGAAAGGRELAGLGVWLKVGVVSDWMVELEVGWRSEMVAVGEVKAVSLKEVLMGRPALGQCWME